MIAGNPTGDSYVIHFPTGDAGGPCIYSGTGRYLISSGGTLTFQILGDCGKLRRGYSYMISAISIRICAAMKRRGGIFAIARTWSRKRASL
jgi:hypothetical protein